MHARLPGRCLSRQTEAGPQAAILTVLECNRAAMTLGNGFHKSEPKPRAARFCAARTLQSYEGLEDTLALGFRNPGTFILYDDLVCLCAIAQVYLGFLAIGDRILDQISNGTSDLVWPAGQRRRGMSFPGYRLAHLFQVGADTFDQSRQVDFAHGLPADSFRSGQHGFGQLLQ